MKRTILFALSLLLLTGCQSVPPAATEGTARPAVSHQPPALTVRVGENEGAAALSTYSWDWPNPDGTHSGVEADGLHPLDMLDYVTPILLGEERTVELRFEGAAKPDHLTIRRWDRSCAGDPSKYESNYDMLSCTMEGDTLTAALPDGLGGVFEVHAYFTGESHGDGYYTFCLQGVELPRIQPILFDPLDAQTVRIVWRESLSEFPQAQIIRSHEELLSAIGADGGYESAGDLLDVMAATWNDDRFAQYDLILLRIESGSGSISYRVEGVRRTEEGVIVSVRAQVPEICTADMAAWLIFLRLPAGAAGDGPVTVSIATENIK